MQSIDCVLPRILLLPYKKSREINPNGAKGPSSDIPKNTFWHLAPRSISIPNCQHWLRKTPHRLHPSGSIWDVRKHKNSSKINRTNDHQPIQKSGHPFFTVPYFLTSSPSLPGKTPCPAVARRVEVGPGDLRGCPSPTFTKFGTSFQLDIPVPEKL